MARVIITVLSFFFDSQILSEWEGSDKENASSTIRNFFHGPFVNITGAF